MDLIRTKVSLVALGTAGAALVSAAQEPVLLAGGSTPPTPVAAAFVTGATYPLPVMPVACGRPVIPVGCPAPACYPRPGQVVSGGYYNAPNVVYFGGPNSCYYSTYPGDCYRPGCAYSSPSVIYFGRGEGCERGYAFRHYR